MENSTFTQTKKIPIELFENKHTIVPRLYSILEKMQSNGDEVHAEQINELIQKWLKEELIVTFSGHFSAGKSSLINELMGEQILPSSPIPTSANVIEIRSGERAAIIHSSNGEEIRFELTDDLAEIKSYSKSGEIEKIELSLPLPWSKSIVYMDTPGIDSTDDAHKRSTESALHLSDILIYTMDYNHVQSEFNFHFIKAMQNLGKWIVLVVNQIDKHNDDEISFDRYKESVEQAFAAWEIQPKAIFYTTLKEPTYRYNELPLLKEQLNSWFEQAQLIREHSLIYSVQHIIDSHAEWMMNQRAEEREALQDLLLDDRTSEGMAERAENLDNQIQTLQQLPIQIEDETKAEIQKIIDNANLTPYTIRDLAKAFLESRKPGFKVGVLFTSSKTEQEKENRLNQFFQAFKEQLSAHLIWHIRDTLLKLSNKCGPSSEEVTGQIHHWTFEVQPDFLIEEIHEGALNTLSGEAVINYSSDLSQKVKSLVRKQAFSFLDQILTLIDEEAKQQIQQLEQQSSDILDWLKIKHRITEIDQSIANHKNELTSEWMQGIQKGMISISSRETSNDPISVDRPSHQQMNRYEISWERNNMDKKDIPSEKEVKGRKVLETAAGHLKDTAECIKSIHGLQKAANEMSARSNRLEQNQFTVALFGAFSAGKSSFANALMGNRVLPVSPNPTTATINKILPPDEQHPHGTVVVQLKAKQQLWEEMLISLKLVNFQAASIESSLEQLNHLVIEDWSPSIKPHVQFLKAIHAGYPQMEAILGQQQYVDAVGFQTYVAEESKAVFVESIELYYDCPLTNQGISLVDTPGADSINARHTGVAFEYIKNADAVIFVTYYNHAFSNADRDFLNQLGRVKDTFGMDKMFFIVNAADLAQSEDELLSVIGHVKDNLESHGIRHPRIYPVSSKLALQAKLSADPSIDSNELKQSGLSQFEADFFTFIIEELTQVAVSSSISDIDRSYRQLNEMIQLAQEDANTREQKKLEAEKNYKQSMALDLDISSDFRSIDQEVSELLFYVKKRCFDRFNETFQYSFNPSVLNDQARDMKKMLRQCLDELLHQIAYDLGQEGRATALRMEKYLRLKGSQYYGKWQDQLNVIVGEFEISTIDEWKWDTPDFPDELPANKHPLASVLSLFKNPRHFFEKDGKKEMRDQLEKLLHPIVDDYISIVKKQLVEMYIGAYEKMTNTIKADVKDQLKAYFEGIQMSLNGHNNVYEWQEIATNMQKKLDDLKRSISFSE